MRGVGLGITSDLRPTCFCLRGVPVEVVEMVMAAGRRWGACWGGGMEGGGGEGAKVGGASRGCCCPSSLPFPLAGVRDGWRLGEFSGGAVVIVPTPDSRLREGGGGGVGGGFALGCGEWM